MFEKEAEEIAEEYYYKTYPVTLNIGEEERKKEVTDIFLAGYNKANEWHYVKDELPPVKKEYNGRSELVLVLSKEKEMQYAQYVEKEKTWARGICEIGFKPYAWKEIILPVWR